MNVFDPLTDGWRKPMGDRAALFNTDRGTIAIFGIKWQQAIDMISFSRLW
jgi:hypothetical protein